MERLFAGLNLLVVDYLPDTNLSTILQNNIDKLMVRYNGQFSEEKALNRNLEAERKELEK